MIKIGWFSPISVRTGISSYTKSVLQAMSDIFPRDVIDVVVFHPEAEGETVTLPYPSIELSDGMIRTDISALYDIAIYHIGNNSLNHQPIYDALLRHPGVVVLHDHVYQHFLAGLHHGNRGISSSFGALVQDSGGGAAFEILDAAGVLPVDGGNARFVPWETEWATAVPLGDLYARLSYGAVVHSTYAYESVNKSFAGEVCKLFMPTPLSETLPVQPPVEARPIRIICAGHIQKTKGLQLLVAAFEMMPELRDRYEVIIAGHPSDPSFLTVLRAEIDKFDLNDVIKIVISPDEARYTSIVATADIHYNLRFPNTEGASLSLSEQLASGRPVIAYRTGSFAELPEDVCYFLDRIGDAGEVAALLGQIANNRGDISKRGAKAWDIAKRLSATTYAEGLISFLRENHETFSRRAEISQTRAKGTLPGAAQCADPWVKDFASTRHLVRAAHRGSQTIPRNLFDASSDEVGRFVCLNQLQVRADPANMTRIGAMLLAMPRTRAIELIGLLYAFSPAHVATGNFAPALLPICVPVLHPGFWEVVLQLSPRAGIEMAARAIYGAQDEPLQKILTERAESIGIGAALAEHLDDSTLWQEGFFKPVRSILASRKFDGLRNALPYVPGENVVNMLPEIADHGSVILSGFNDPEDVGIWTKDNLAQIYVRTDTPVRRLHGEYDVLDLDTQNPQLGAISVTEIDTGRSLRVSMTEPETAPAANTFALDLPGVSGLICIEIMSQKITNLAAQGLSTDNRDLGLMLKSLTLHKSDIEPDEPEDQ